MDSINKYESIRKKGMEEIGEEVDKKLDGLFDEHSVPAKQDEVPSFETKEMVEEAFQPEKAYYTGKELVELGVKEFPMLINPLFPKAGLAVLAGSSDTGKSTLLRQLAISIVKGDETFLNYPIHAEHNRVVYVSTEDDKLAISYLLNKSSQVAGCADVLENLHYVFRLDRPYKDLDAMLSKHPADCIIVDAFSDLFPGDMHHVNKVRAYMNQFFILADKYNCLVIFLHHTGKHTEEKPPNKNNLIGSQGIEGKARQVIELRHDPKNSRYRHLCIVKGNYVEDDLKTHSYKLLFKNQYFEMTEERVDFDYLVDNFEDRKKDKEDRLLGVAAYAESGLSYSEIAEKMAEDGYNISKSTVGNYVQEARKRGLLTK